VKNSRHSGAFERNSRDNREARIPTPLTGCVIFASPQASQPGLCVEDCALAGPSYGQHFPQRLQAHSPSLTDIRYPLRDEHRKIPDAADQRYADGVLQAMRTHLAGSGADLICALRNYSPNERTRRCISTCVVALAVSWPVRVLTYRAALVAGREYPGYLDVGRVSAEWWLGALPLPLGPRVIGSRWMFLLVDRFRRRAFDLLIVQHRRQPGRASGNG